MLLLCRIRGENIVAGVAGVAGVVGVALAVTSQIEYVVCLIADFSGLVHTPGSHDATKRIR